MPASDWPACSGWVWYLRTSFLMSGDGYCNNHCYMHLRSMVLYCVSMFDIN